MLTAKQAAAHLGLGLRTIYTLARRQELACHRFGAAIRFDLADLDAYKTRYRSAAITPASGTTSLTATSTVSGSALTSYFRKAGRDHRPTHTTAANRPGFTTLRLVEQSQSQ